MYCTGDAHVVVIDSEDKVTCVRVFAYQVIKGT